MEIKYRREKARQNTTKTEFQRQKLFFCLLKCPDPHLAPNERLYTTVSDRTVRNIFILFCLFFFFFPFCSSQPKRSSILLLSSNGCSLFYHTNHPQDDQCLRTDYRKEVLHVLLNKIFWIQANSHKNQ